MKHVLVVDDDAFVARMIEQKLDAGFQVTRSSGIDHALGVIRGGGRFHVIFCRTHCGGTDGGRSLWERLKIEVPDQSSRIIFFDATTVPRRSEPRVWS